MTNKHTRQYLPEKDYHLPNIDVLSLIFGKTVCAYAVFSLTYSRLSSRLDKRRNRPPRRSSRPNQQDHESADTNPHEATSARLPPRVWYRQERSEQGCSGVHIIRSDPARTSILWRRCGRGYLQRSQFSVPACRAVTAVEAGQEWSPAREHRHERCCDRSCERMQYSSLTSPVLRLDGPQARAKTGRWQESELS